MAVAQMGSVTAIAAEAMPRGLTIDLEPRAELPTTGLGDVIELITKDETLEGGHQGTQTSVPADDVLFTVTGDAPTATQYPSGWSGGSRSITNYRVTGGVIKTCIFPENKRLHNHIILKKGEGIAADRLQRIERPAVDRGVAPGQADQVAAPQGQPLAELIRRQVARFQHFSGGQVDLAHL